MSTPAFPEVMDFTRNVGSHTSFEDAECELMYKCAVALPKGSLIVEIGVEYGRSTSILAQISKADGHTLHCIDPFVDADSAPKFMEMMRRVNAPFTMHMMKSEDVYPIQGLVKDGINLLHIDGDHSAEAIMLDCQLLAFVDELGIVLFHDYGRDSLPSVYPTVNWIMQPNWEICGQAGTLVAWRRK